MDKATNEALKGIEKLVSKIEENIKESIRDLHKSLKDIDELKKCYSISRSVEAQQWGRMNTMQNSLDMNVRDGNLREKKIQSLEENIRSEVEKLHKDIIRIPEKIKTNRKWIITTIIASIGMAAAWIEKILTALKHAP
jgi:vacuolar-type H+-ATPase subunit E/Vma4